MDILALLACLARVLTTTTIRQPQIRTSQRL